ncbi:hypothetical protein [Skermanella stibiiresistens]|uniref:hypothetical protein n=1 Tax=Skermanella stibiiresistens TaxID=913326 RepID=UPI0012FCC054|nr:hypothetical protein [Skermanella stibiiresistens]
MSIIVSYTRVGLLSSAILVLLAVSGCEDSVTDRNPLLSPERATGSFCDQLHYVIIQGTDGLSDGGYFAQIRGRRIDEDRHNGTVLIEGASSCYVDYGLGTLDARYICVFADAPLSRRGELLAVLNRLESRTEACISRQNLFGYSFRGVDKPRYHPMGRVGGDGDRVWFSDRYRGQDVHLDIDENGNNGRVVMSVDSK